MWKKAPNNSYACLAKPNYNRFLLCSLIVSWVLTGTGCASSSTNNISLSPTGSTIDDMAVVADTARALGLKYGNESVLIAFDIDNTLLAATTPLGSDQWFDWQSEDSPEDEKITEDFGCLLNVQGVLYHLGSMRTTQPNLTSIIDGLQERRFPVISITSRGTDFRLVTHREFRRNGLDFARTAIGDALGDTGTYMPYEPGNVTGFSEEEIQKFKLTESSSRPRLVRYEDGVYLTAGQHKGAMLRLLMQRFKVTDQIKAVIFLDDKDRHIKGMNEALESIGIAAYAYRYSREDPNVEAFRDNVNGMRLKAKREWCVVAGKLRTHRDLFGLENYPLNDTCLDASQRICDGR
ncbi:MAG: DUF2608 domain-containing protein [Pseudomonadota bacterium]